MTQIADMDIMRGSLEVSAAKQTMEPPAAAEQQAVQSEQSFKQSFNQMGAFIRRKQQTTSIQSQPSMPKTVNNRVQPIGLLNPLEMSQESEEDQDSYRFNDKHDFSAREEHPDSMMYNMNSEEPTARSFFGQRHADPGDMLLKRVTEEEEKTIVPQLSFNRK